MSTPPHTRSPTPTVVSQTNAEISHNVDNKRDTRAEDLDSDNEATIVSASGPRRIKMRRINVLSRPTAAEAVAARYREVKRKHVDNKHKGRKARGKDERGRAGPSAGISEVLTNTRVVRVVFWTAHNTRPTIVYARLSKDFVQLAAAPALMDFLQLPRNMQWDRWDEYQCTWTTNCTVHDKFWVPWASSTILGRVHAADPEAHGRVGGVIGLPAFGRELTRLEARSRGMAQQSTPLAHVPK